MNYPKLSPLSSKIDLIMGVKGQEYQSIISRIPKNWNSLQKLAIPAGLSPVMTFLKRQYQSTDFFNKPSNGVLLMGLCGSLSPRYRVGQGILYQGCGYQTTEGQWRYLSCDSSLTQALAQWLGKDCLLGKGISCDRIITQKEDKLKLGETYQVDVVDMESFAVLDFFGQQGIPVTILRVVSDDCQQNLPNLTDVFDKNGEMKPLYLAQKLLQHPLASFELIRSSLTALKALERITQKLTSVKSQ